MKKKVFKVFSLLLICFSLTSVSAFAGTWGKNDKSGDICYRDNNGNVQYGWFKDDEYAQWHYASKWAGVHTDWLYDRDYNTYYHWDAMGRYDGNTPYLEKTDSSIHDGWVKIDETYSDSVVFFCQKGLNGVMCNIYYPSSVSQADFLNGNVSHIYCYNTYTGEIQRVDLNTSISQ